MKAQLSADEFIYTLKNSSLPTVVTEGEDDYTTYRRIERDLADFGASLFPVGGRSMVLSIFARRREIGRNNVLFLVDNDLWLYLGLPNEYDHRKIITTDGYSLENDMYRDGDAEAYLTQEERITFQSELAIIASWHAFAIEKHRAGDPIALAYHPNEMLHDGELRPDFARRTGFLGTCEATFAVLIQDYARMLRGKTLMQLIVRRLSAPRRPVKFGHGQLLEIGAVRRGPHYCRIRDAIAAGLAATA